MDKNARLCISPFGACQRARKAMAEQQQFSKMIVV